MNNRNKYKTRYRALRALIKSIRKKLDFLEEVLNTNIPDNLKKEMVEEISKEVANTTSKMVNYFTQESHTVIPNDMTSSKKKGE